MSEVEMLTIAGGILLAYAIFAGVIIGCGIVLGIISLPFRMVHMVWQHKRRKPAPILHHGDELPDYLGDFD